MTAEHSRGHESRRAAILGGSWGMWRGGRLTVVGLLIVLLGACTGGSSGEVAEATAAPEGPTSTATPSDDPTSTPVATPTVGVSAPSEQDRIDAAMAVLEAADPLPSDMVAYDLIEATVSGSLVDIDVCGWEGDTVFDDVYVISYRTSVSDDGSVSATLESAILSVGECTNTTLVESALQATRDYDTYWSAVLEDPASFDPDEAAEVMTPGLVRTYSEDVATWVAEGLSYKHTDFDGMLPASSTTAVLGRSYEDGGLTVLEVGACRPLPDAYGLYRGDLLIDDRRTDDARGSDAIAYYRMTVVDAQMRVLGVGGRVWSDCNISESEWIEGMNVILPDPVPWGALLS